MNDFCEYASLLVSSSQSIIMCATLQSGFTVGTFGRHPIGRDVCQLKHERGDK